MPRPTPSTPSSPRPRSRRWWWTTNGSPPSMPPSTARWTASARPHPAREGTGRTLRNPAAADQPRVAELESQREPPPGEDGVLMEVKPGYKQTEVGVIPEDWEVADAARRSAASSPNGYARSRSNVLREMAIRLFSSRISTIADSISTSTRPTSTRRTATHGESCAADRRHLLIVARSHGRLAWRRSCRHCMRNQSATVIASRKRVDRTSLRSSMSAQLQQQIDSRSMVAQRSSTSTSSIVKHSDCPLRHQRPNKKPLPRR